MAIGKAGARCVGIVALVLFGPLQEYAHAETGMPASALMDAQQGTHEASKLDQDPKRSDLQITPEGLMALQAAGTPHLLVDADADAAHVPAPGPVRIIYYTRSPAFRSALSLALRDRNANPAAEEPSQRLTGTPQEWVRLKLPFPQPVELAKPVALTPRQLSQALRDEVDVQILDVRPRAQGSAGDSAAFSNSLRVLPDQAMAESRSLSRQRWTIVVDQAGAIAPTLAEELRSSGFLLAGYLDGGYAAWAAATDRDLTPAVSGTCAKP